MKMCILGEEVLRQKALPVKTIDDSLRTLIADMFTTMHEQNGIGLAAPQVGKSIRLFVIELDDKQKRIFINPHIIKNSQEISTAEEGCLSIPGLYYDVTRSTQVTVQAVDEYGKAFTLDASGLLARAIQHEYDHLEGILYIDRINADLKQKAIDVFERRQKRKAEKQREKQKRRQKILDTKKAEQC